MSDYDFAGETFEAAPPDRTDADRAAARERYQWQLDRRRPVGHFVLPTPGFGNGQYTLWLPSPKVEQRYGFKDGIPFCTIVPSCATQPNIARLRDLVLGSFRDEAGVYRVDIGFMQYTAAVIAMNYVVTDDDLSMLLSGTQWHDGAMKHLLGGEDTIAKLIELAKPLPAVKSPVLPPAFQAIKPKPHRSITAWFRSLWRINVGSR